MKFNFISDNLSVFACILVKESLISLYSKSYGIDNTNFVSMKKQQIKQYH